MAKKKVKTVELTDAQKRLIRDRWTHWKRAVVAAQNASWFRRKRAWVNAGIEYTILQSMLVFGFGEGAVLDMNGPEPTITLP